MLVVIEVKAMRVHSKRHMLKKVCSSILSIHKMTIVGSMKVPSKQHPNSSHYEGRFSLKCVKRAPQSRTIWCHHDDATSAATPMEYSRKDKAQAISSQTDKLA